MSNIKAPALEVSKICKTVPTKSFNRLIETNTESGRANQWKNVKSQFLSNCDTAKIISLSPNPNSQSINKLDPEWSQTVADRVISNQPSVGGRKGSSKRSSKRTRKGTYKSTRKSTRKNRH
jgi:hypothetical protein